MAAGDLALNILVSASTASATSVISQLGQSISMLASNPMAAVGLAAAAAGAGMIAFGVKAVQAAGGFQSSMTSLVTGAGELQSNLGMVSQGVLKMSVDTATSTDQLSKGLYMIESAGYHGAAGLQVLQTAAQGAKVGNADLGVTANALTTILTDYHLKASDATGAMNALITTVASGKTHLQDLAGAMGSVLPLASSLGISFPQVAGAIATMTNAGMDAQRASMNLANTIRSLAAPNSAATKSMQAVGLSAQQLHDTLTHQGLAAAIQEVSDAVGKKFPAGSVQAVQAFKSIMGGATGYNVALMLGGKNMAAYESNIKNISGAMSAGGNAVQGWSAVQGDFNFKIQQAQAAFNVLMITVGTALLPVIGRIVGAITPAITAFSNMIASGQGMPPLFQQIANAWGQFANNLDVGEIIGEFQQFQQTVSKTGAEVKSALGPFITGLNNLLISLAGYLTGLVAPALQIGSQLFAGLGHVLATVMSSVTSTLLPALHNLVVAIAPIVIAIVQWVANSHILPVIFTVLGVAISVVITVLSFLINVIAAVVTWFSTTALGIATFRAILIVLGVAIGIIAIVILSVVIPAFIAWVAGAIAVGIANIIAFAPIVLIVLAIIAVVAIVVLVITHWGQIAHWLQGVWAAVVNWFKSAWGATGAWFQALWSTVSKAVMGFFGGVGAFFVNLWNSIKNGAVNAWNGLINGIKNIVQAGINWLINGWSNVVNMIVGFFIWLYNHNYYFKDLVDGIVNVFNWCKEAVIAIWNGIVNVLTYLWNGIVNVAKTILNAIQTAWNVSLNFISNLIHTIWNAIASFFIYIWNGIVNSFRIAWNFISSIVTTAANAVWKFLVGIFNQVASFFVWIWNGIVNSVRLAWNAISGVFSSAWNTYIAGPLGGLWNSFSGWFGNLANQAFQWGKNLIQGIINGMNNMLGAVGQTAQNIMHNIAGFLGFHSPAEKGEGRYIVEWGQNLVKGFVQGMQNAMPLVNGQINHMISAPNVALAGASAGNSFALQSPVSSNQPQTMNLQINMDGKKITEAVGVRMAREVRIQGGVRNV